MERYQVLQGLLALFEAPAYLEVGVDKGETFHGLRAGSKIAVDPTFSFDVDAARQQADNQNCRYFNVTSDQFFQTEAPVHRFDVIYIDGLHTFEQTLRDFLNATVALNRPDVHNALDAEMGAQLVNTLRALEANPPPAPGGKRIKLRYITQNKTRPPTFVLSASQADELGKDYIRFLVNRLRDDFGMPGVPIRLSMRKAKNPFAGRAKKQR